MSCGHLKKFCAGENMPAGTRLGTTGIEGNKVLFQKSLPNKC